MPNQIVSRNATQERPHAPCDTIAAVFLNSTPSKSEVYQEISRMVSQFLMIIIKLPLTIFMTVIKLFRQYRWEEYVNSRIGTNGN